jgi:hypothetical protein
MAFAHLLLLANQLVAPAQKRRSQPSTRIPPRNASTDMEPFPRRESPAEPRGYVTEQSVQLVV